MPAVQPVSAGAPSTTSAEWFAEWLFGPEGERLFGAEAIADAKHAKARLAEVKVNTEQQDVERDRERLRTLVIRTFGPEAWVEVERDLHRGLRDLRREVFGELDQYAVRRRRGAASAVRVRRGRCEARPSTSRQRSSSSSRTSSQDPGEGDPEPPACLVARGLSFHYGRRRYRWGWSG